MNAVLPLIAAAIQTGSPAPLTIADVEPLVGTTRGMSLADRVLPPEVRAGVVEGSVRRPWGPQMVYWIGFREPARVAGSDLCERGGHAVEGTIAADIRGIPPPDTPLTLGKVRSWTELAVLPPGEWISAARCESADYVADDGDAPRTIAAYRVLVAAMTAARRPGALPFRVTCKAEKPQACADPRTALARLPMDALIAVRTSCLESEKIRRRYQDSNVFMVRCPTMKAGQPYEAEVRFRGSPPDGRSWSVEFVHRAGWPDEVRLSRSTVIYH